MTLCLLLGGIDGFLALADGRRARKVGDGAPEWQSDTDTKIVAVPGMAVVLLAAGRATYNRRPNAEVLLDLFDAYQPTSEASVADVAEHLRVSLQRLDRIHPHADDAGISVLVAGYEANVGQHVLPQVMLVHAPAHWVTTDHGDPAAVDVEVLVVDPQLPILGHQSGSDTCGLVTTEFDMFVEALDADTLGMDGLDVAYRFAGLTVAALRPMAIERVQGLLGRNAETAEADGVGGYWSAAEVRPHGTVTVEGGMRIGPFVADVGGQSRP